MKKLKEGIKGIHLYSFGILRRLYNWTLSWAQTPYGAMALFILAFAESSFFPVPPDILLIALCVAVPKKSFKYALICTVGSIIGGIVGYYIGWTFYETIGKAIITTLHYEHYFEIVGGLYSSNAFIAILGAAFTPIPYKVFTIAAGVWKIKLSTLVIASVIGRGARFFIVSALIFFFGAKIKAFIDKYFNMLTIVFLALLIGGFLVVKYLI